MLCLAYSEGQAYRTLTALYKKQPVHGQTGNPSCPWPSFSTSHVKAKVLDRRSFPNQSRTISGYCLMANAIRKVSTLASCRTADDEIETLNSTKNIQHVFPSRIFSKFDRQVREALPLLAQSDIGSSCWLCRDEHAIYRCLCLTFETAIVHGLPELWAPHNCRCAHKTAVDAEDPGKTL